MNPVKRSNRRLHDEGLVARGFLGPLALPIDFNSAQCRGGKDQEERALEGLHIWAEFIGDLEMEWSP
jgi:hypothetical protein